MLDGLVGEIKKFVEKKFNQKKEKKKESERKKNEKEVLYHKFWLKKKSKRNILSYFVLTVLIKKKFLNLFLN